MVCGTPPDGRRTVNVPAAVSLAFGDEYIYSCHPDYYTDASDMELKTTCLADGSFSLTDLPVCIGKCNNISIVCTYNKYRVSHI